MKILFATEYYHPFTPGGTPWSLALLAQAALRPPGGPIRPLIERVAGPLRQELQGALEAGPDLDAQVRHAFEVALLRAPTATEHAACLQVGQEHGLSVVCRVLFNTNEFLFLP